MTWQEPQDDPEWRSAYEDYGQKPTTGQYGQAPHAPDPHAPDPYAQNPYAQNPYAQDPYAQNPYAQGPYAQDPYGQYDYAAYGPGAIPRTSTPGTTVAALVANIVTAVVCCMGIAWIPGVILSAVALNRARTDPESARRLTIGAWVCFAVDIVLAVGALVVLGLVGDGGNSTTTP
jgi:hypothetical protein